MRKRIKTEVFAELSDPVLFPRLSDAEIEQLAERGERRTFETGELLFEQGMRDAPFFVIEHGTVDIIDRRLEEDVWFARMDGGTFIGDVSMFTGEPTIAAGVADEPTSVIAFERPELREMLAELPDFGELVLQTMTARRAWLEGNEVGVLRLIASRGSGRAFEVRDLLERNLLPVRWYDVDTDAESAARLNQQHRLRTAWWTNRKSKPSSPDCSSRSTTAWRTSGRSPRSQTPTARWRAGSQRATRPCIAARWTSSLIPQRGSRSNRTGSHEQLGERNDRGSPALWPRTADRRTSY